MISLIATLWALSSPLAAPGCDGAPALVPLLVSLQVVSVAQHHDLEVTLMGAVLVAENRSRAYDPATVGRYGAGGERGLYQIAAEPWTAEVVERCTGAGRRGHARYHDAAPCLVLEGLEHGDVDLFSVSHNVEAAAVVLWYLRARGAERAARGVRHDWIALYRCHPRAYRSGTLSRNCAGSVWRVRRWQHDLQLEQDRARALLEALALAPFQALAQPRASPEETATP